ncbi:GNAT family N-acetyltransferase [Tychonema sp. LEGE 07199]|uniref:GNAT family N-acetyltransferase n=1 Tax=unclassified Tychonema TaxID=2642144 RepID=UPI00187E43A6|nr:MULTISPECIES: GNAT family N-acetyltransferase [unclassified Tychonema]MBE9121416.1 GNAT family N-acetyltransferase [Tychonema sp. LEGE 07199]MBE9134634.1 GNAT family N-acetyltransferase [Tychonema sp. LEGE 07196]
MPQIHIREVQNAQELEEMFYQRWLVLRSPLGMEKGSERDDREDGAVHLIGMCDRKIIASARLRESSPGLGSISYVAVLPEFQNQGIGTKLIENLIVKAQAKNLKTLRLKSRINAIKFYQRIGFTEEGNPSDFLGIPHVFMQLEI